MGNRTVKRVPLDFKWPMSKVWKGYVNPNSGPRDCRACNGSGLNPQTNQISEDFYDHEGFGERWMYAYGVDPEGRPASRPPWAIRGECRAWENNITQDEVEALVKAGRLMDFTHTWTPGVGWKRREDGYVPTAAEVNAWNARGGMGGHDCINRWILIKARAKRLGVYGKCVVCKGKGQTKLPRKMKKAYNGWESYEPPTGEGWQLWETVSEGSPISVVCATADELAEWCFKNTDGIGPGDNTPLATWKRLIKGEEDIETGSLIVGIPDIGYVGSLADAPR